MLDMEKKEEKCLGTITLDIKELEGLFVDIVSLANEIRDVIKEGVDNNTYVILYLLGKQVGNALLEVGSICN